MDPELYKKKLAEVCDFVENADARLGDTRKKIRDEESHPIVILRMHDQPHDCERCDRRLKKAPVVNIALLPDGRRIHCSGCNRMLEGPGKRLPTSLPRVKGARGRPKKIKTEPDTPKRPPGRPKRQLEPSLLASNPVDAVEVLVREYPECQITQYRYCQDDAQH
jgi:hypothetical protein